MMSIRVESLGKSFGAPALEDVSFVVESGDFAVILGPTGAGKTTLLRTLCGVETPDSGRILFDGDDVTHVSVRKRPVAMVYQQFVNYPSMTVYENIASPIRLTRPKPSRDEIDSRVRKYAAMLGVDELLDRRPEQLSGGQQQRTAIARALAKEAKYIFLDEPLANLDYKLREELRSELKRVFSETGGAVVYATSEPIDALSMATHVGVMQNGRLEQFGPVDEVYQRPQTAAIAEYFSHPAMNVWRAECSHENSTAVARINGTVELQLNHDVPDGPCKIGTRAHHIQLGGGTNAIPATIELAEVVGSDTELHLNANGLPIVAFAQHVQKYDIGDSINVSLDPAACFVFNDTTGELIAAPQN